MHGLIRDIHDQRWRRNFENFNFLRGFLVCFVHYGYAKCEIMYHRLVLYLNMYYHLPFSCGTLLKSKNWFDVLNFRFSQLHDYSGYTIIRDSRVTSKGLTSKGLTSKVLTSKGLTSKGLTSKGLMSEALTSEGLTSEGLTSMSPPILNFPILSLPESFISVERNCKVGKLMMKCKTLSDHVVS